MKFLIKILLCLFIITFVLFLFMKNINRRDEVLMQKGEEIIIKIEEYKRKNGHLPKTLKEIGFEQYEAEENANSFYYNIVSDSVYTISFMMSIDYNKFYYSDTKQWENGYRKCE